ncbi:cytochrome c prime [Oceanimonas sp. GK1]|uniref:c-type cytochrome n=1 Tax=Oceanimonas sp. (strain GK1 / IBRC-M 10197) TaxID=511062 RepID=UPI0002494CB8|nr:cytochrome c [Oceanimonas sp. GK1]AEY00066.1 cytochrome c prime [Oceanimonas sp. GK1]
MLKKALIVSTALFAASVSAQAELFKPEDAVKYRQSLYQVMAAQAGVIGGMAKGEIDFDAAALHQRAINLSNAAGLLGETYFPETREVKASNMLAKGWEDREGMQARGKDFGEALQNLVQVSGEAGFDQAQARKAAGELFKTCKGCHDDYRKD